MFNLNIFNLIFNKKIYLIKKLKLRKNNIKKYSDLNQFLTNPNKNNNNQQNKNIKTNNNNANNTNSNNNTINNNNSNNNNNININIDYFNQLGNNIIISVQNELINIDTQNLLQNLLEILQNFQNDLITQLETEPEENKIKNVLQKNFDLITKFLINCIELFDNQKNNSLENLKECLSQLFTIFIIL